MNIRCWRLLLISTVACGLMLAACRSVVPMPTATATHEPTPQVTSSPISTRRPTASPTAGCADEHGQLERSSYLSPQLDQEIPLWIYLPPCFPLAGENLPVVFFFHGKPFDQSHWVEIDLVDSYRIGLSSGRWGRALLVLPQLPEPLFSSSDGGPGSYEQEFMEVVIPKVENRFQPSAAQLSLAGISRGGIWALEIGLRHPTKFAKVAALSPSLAVNYPRQAYDPFFLARNQEEYPGEMLLLAGEQDWARPKTAELAADLERAGARVQLQIVAGDHQDLTWAQALPQVLDFLLPSIEAK